MEKKISQVALARGWERDLDYAYDAEFYDGTHGRVGLMNRLVRAAARRADSALTSPAG